MPLSRMFGSVLGADLLAERVAGVTDWVRRGWRVDAGPGAA
jgi:hypothetical protein